MLAPQELMLTPIEAAASSRRSEARGEGKGGTQRQSSAADERRVAAEASGWPGHAHDEHVRSASPWSLAPLNFILRRILGHPVADDARAVAQGTRFPARDSALEPEAACTEG